LIKKWSRNVVKQYRTLENQGTETRKDDILRAAVSAFVALTQPTKRDSNQIEDLALSILPFTSDSTKRFVGAALANSHSAPNALVRRLCDEPADICAPLLLKSPALTPLDLTVIVGTKSRDHARIISKRAHLPNSVIEALALLDDPVAKARVTYGNVSKVSDLQQSPQGNLKPVSADEARERLREILAATFIRPKGEVNAADQKLESGAHNNYASRLLKLALQDQEGLFMTALADLSGLPFAKIVKLIRRKSSGELSALLKAYDVDANSAFVICTVFYPDITASRTDIRLFLDRHNTMDTQKAKDMVRSWKAAEVTALVNRRPANSVTQEINADLAIDDLTDWDAIVKAS
jgi:uncharacterized protein (DUF2336 family)